MVLNFMLPNTCYFGDLFRGKMVSRYHQSQYWTGKLFYQSRGDERQSGPKQDLNSEQRTRGITVKYVFTNALVFHLPGAQYQYQMFISLLLRRGET